MTLQSDSLLNYIAIIAAYWSADAMGGGWWMGAAGRGIVEGNLGTQSGR